MTKVRALWRHPIKGHGREELSQVRLTAGQTMPWDRRWAVAHELADLTNGAWSPCQNFSRGSKVPALMAINTRTNETTGLLTLSHPDLADLTFDPDREADAFLNWVRPLMPANRAQSTAIVRARNVGMTDTDYASVSLINLASNAALSKDMDADISPRRWRGNIWFDGFPAWQEFDLIGKNIRIGEVELSIIEPIVRCLATTANPDTGQRDLDTLKTLNDNYGHQDFGVYAKVIKGGPVHVNDPIEVI